MIESGFQVYQPEVRLATIQFINENSFLDTTAETHPEYLEQCIIIYIISLSQIVPNPKLLPLYITIITHCLTHGKVVTDPIPLLAACLEYFSAEQPNDNTFNDDSSNH